MAPITVATATTAAAAVDDAGLSWCGALLLFVSGESATKVAEDHQ